MWNRTSIKKTAGWGTALSGVILAMSVTSASADTVTATYRLHDHPGGNQNPPPYGLRLDELGDFPTVTNSAKEEYLFSADTNGSELFLDIIETTAGDLQMHIHGTMYGGLQDRSTDPDTLDAVKRGVAEVDFWYRDHVAAGNNGVGDPAIYTVTDQNHDIADGNNGYIKWRGTTYYLQDQMGSLFSARLAKDHRTPASPDTISFWGWVNHSTDLNATLPSGTPSSPDYKHFYSSDWLLTATRVAPVPAAAWTGLSLLGGIGVVSKRRKMRS